jgi:penicillin-binding protein 2
LRLGICFFLSACTGLGPPPTVTPLPTPTATPDTPDPEGTALTFLTDWQNGDYAGMYSLLSPLSRDAVSLNDFRARYESVAQAITLTSVEAKVLSVLKNGPTAHVLYSLTLHTAIVGDIPSRTEMQLIYADGRWAISWTEAMILPELAGGNALVMEYSQPARANIYDRNGLGLAVQGQGKAVAVGVLPGKITDEAGVLSALSSLLGLAPEAIKQKYAAVPPDWYVPIGETSAEAVQANYDTLSALDGVVLTPYTTRDYLFNGVAPQVVGYMSSIPPEALAEYQAKGYSGDERVGRAGIEAWGEQHLAGRRGGRLNVITPTGQVAATLAESQSQPAQAVYTTLDRSLQIEAQKALGDFTGSIVVMDPQTGEVLAMVSNPTFDPNLFEPTNPDHDALKAVLDDPGNPLLNRAAQGQYPPGSVFKVATMAAGLTSGLYARDTIYNCTGKWDLLGPEAIKYDWTVYFGRPPHGRIDLVQALAFSCDPYFYTIAYNLYDYNPDYLSQIARQFGLGEYTQIGQAAEAQGLIPDAKWKLATYGEQWTPGDNVNMGIGQGYVLVTPLQIAQMMAAVRNGGTLYRPQLVHHIAPPGGAPTYQFEPIVNGQLPVGPEQLALLQEGLRSVTTLPGGTARHRFLNLGIPVAGKTGTAENPGASGAPHAWFAGYTEANRPDKPDIVIVVLVENTGEGSEFAAPIFRRIVEIYFFGQPLTLYPWESAFDTPATPTATP